MFDIKAIIFDYGNVLCEPQPQQDIQALAAELDMPVDQFVPMYWRERGSYDRASMDAAEYWSRVAGRQLDSAQIAKLVDLDNKSWTHPCQEMLRWFDILRHKGLKTAMLSNLPISLRDALENDCAWLPRFDVRTYSCTLRKTKPDPAIYDECVRGLGVKAPEIVFLDDRPENIDGAAKLGIHGVVFESAKRAALDLAQRYGVYVRQ